MDPIESRKLIDKFLCFTKQIALEIVKKDIEIAIYLIGEKLPEEKVLEIKEAEQPGVQLVSCLKQSCLLSENNLELFIELLVECRRVDLANRVREYQKTVKVLKDATPAQIKYLIPAHNMESLSLVMPGQPNTITVDQLDHIRKSICRALEIKSSELLYIATDKDGESPCCAQFSLQFPKTEKIINQLQFDALNKKPWLADLKVVELKVDSNSSIKMNR